MNLIGKEKYIADVIIPHHDRDDLLARCIKYINRNKFNIIVEFGGSFAENCNKGAQKAVTKNMIFVNDDTEPGDFILEKMCRLDCDVVGIVQRIPDVSGEVFGLGVELAGDGTGRHLAKNIDDFFIPSGFLFKISKKIWDDLGGFDEEFVNGCEDVDLFFRCMEQGCSFGLVDDVVLHRHSQSEGRNLKNEENSIKLDKKWDLQRIKKLLKKNKSLFFEKNKKLHWKKDQLRILDSSEDLKNLDKLPLISVVIPSRIGEKIETLPSLKRQNYSNIEIIIEYDESGSGASATRNKGAKKAKGKYLFFCDNDIELYPDAISNLFLTLIKNPHASWVFGKFYIDGVLRNNGKKLSISSDKKSIEWMKYFEGISTMSLMKSEIFPGFDEEMRRYNDWDLWLNMDRMGYEPAFCNSILFETSTKMGGITTADRIGRVNWIEKLYKKYDINVAGYIYDLENENKMLKKSKSFKVGDLFFRSVKNPHKLLTLPYNFLKMILEKDKT